jgi:uncharacterized protein YfdQ (DUF2303 family)
VLTEPAENLPAGAGEAAVIRDLERLVRGSEPTILRDEETGRGFLIVNGEVAREIPPLTPRVGDVITERVTVYDAESFMAYGRHFKHASSCLFVDVAAPKITLDFDYHDAAAPGYRGHVLTWAMRTSLNWQRWTAIDGRPMTQKAFVEFLEENEIDVREPAGAALREIVQAVEGTKNVSFTNATRLANGDVDVKWTEETEAKTKGGTVLPGQFILGLPIFFGDKEAMQIRAFLRYSVESGKLTFKVMLHRRQEIFETAVTEQAAAVAAALNLKPLVGQVEPRVGG